MSPQKDEHVIITMSQPKERRRSALQCLKFLQEIPEDESGDDADGCEEVDLSMDLLSYTVMMNMNLTLINASPERHTAKLDAFYSRYWEMNEKEIRDS